jgi:hydroxyethylthiazole kinase-like sugar kinase family protein
MVAAVDFDSGERLMKRVLCAVCLTGALMGCSTAPKVADPFDLAISAAMLHMMTVGTAPLPAMQGGDQ